MPGMLRAVYHEDNVQNCMPAGGKLSLCFFSCFLCGRCCFSFRRVFPFEFFHTSRRIENFLFAGDKRMTVGTNIYFDVFFGRSRFNHIATNASDGCFLIIRMNTFFHFPFFLLIPYQRSAIKGFIILNRCGHLSYKRQKFKINIDGFQTAACEL